MAHFNLYNILPTGCKLKKKSISLWIGSIDRYPGLRPGPGQMLMSRSVHACKRMHVHKFAGYRCTHDVWMSGPCIHAAS